LLEDNRYLTGQLQYAQEELARKEDELMLLREQLGHLMLERQAMLTQAEAANLQLDEKDTLIEKILSEQQEKRVELVGQVEREAARRRAAEERAQVMGEAFKMAENAVIAQDQKIYQIIEVVNAIRMDAETASKLSDIKSAIEKEREFH
jgi:hypothetical protein